jgi:hypothetical protein
VQAQMPATELDRVRHGMAQPNGQMGRGMRNVRLDR